MIYLEAVRFNGGIPAKSYLNKLPVVRFLKENPLFSLPAGITLFVGENGTGKSTLLEAIAVAMGFNPEGGSRNFSFSTRDTVSPLSRNLTPIMTAHPRDGFFLRAESFYNTATYIDEIDGLPAASGKIIDSYGGVSLHEQSHGESFLALVQNRFGGNGVYILDEPEAALSPQSQLVLLSELCSLVKRGSQIIAATHSPILLACPGAAILEFTEEGVERTDYSDCGHVRLYRRFLECPERMTSILLNESDEKSP